MSNNRKQGPHNVKKGIDIKYKVAYLISYIVMFFTIPLTGIFINNGKITILIFGLFLIIYSVIGTVFKIPLFNRHYMYESFRFNDSFSVRQYFGFAIMFLFGVASIVESLVS
ncbi:MAG: hypothetical protein CVU91_02270 [Firmicutes bacterium HGW-Firmicutes-16]|nr:MAG: hypothetical protein CVU91_02270 [Firmicutes bacterium HGW-Firmicutes-16]